MINQHSFLIQVRELTLSWFFHVSKSNTETCDHTLITAHTRTVLSFCLLSLPYDNTYTLLTRWHCVN